MSSGKSVEYLLDKAQEKDIEVFYRKIIDHMQVIKDMMEDEFHPTVDQYEEESMKFFEILINDSDKLSALNFYNSLDHIIRPKIFMWLREEV